MIVYVCINHFKSNILPKTKQNFSIFVFALCGCGFVILLGEFFSWGFGEDGDIIRSIVMIYLLILMVIIYKKHISPLSNIPSDEREKEIQTHPFPSQNNLYSVKKQNDDLQKQIADLTRENRLLKRFISGKRLALALNQAAKLKEFAEKEQAQKAEDTRISERLRKLLAYEKDLKERESHICEASPDLIEKAFSDLFVSTGNAFYQSQAKSLNSFYERVKDKRFEKAMIENIHYTTGPAVICRIKSNDKNHPAPYITSLSTCTCQDFRRYKQPCKHMLFLAYHTGYMFLNKEKLEASLNQYIEEIKKQKQNK